jgi:hypothetical protein
MLAILILNLAKPNSQQQAKTRMDKSGFLFLGFFVFISRKNPKNPDSKWDFCWIFLDFYVCVNTYGHRIINLRFMFRGSVRV